MASRELNIVIKAQNLASAALKGVRGELGAIQKEIKKGAANAARNIERGIVVGATAVVGGLAYAVKQAGDFEAALNTINTVAQVSQSELTGIGDALRKMARTTGTSLDDLTAGYYDLVSAGISAKDAQNVLTNANTLAIGGLASTAEAVDLLTTAINSYGGDASKAREFTDQFAQAIAAGKVTAAELAESFAQVGPLAAQAGIGVDELAAGYGVMTATGTPAAEASTQMRSAIVALMKPTADLEQLQKDLNVNFLEMAREKGLAFTYNEIAKAADKAGVPMVNFTGRVEGANFAAQVAGSNYEKYAAALDDVRHASDGAGVAATQMAERQKGLNFQLNRIKEQARDAAITIGTAVIPKLVPLLDKASEWIEAHREDVARFAEDVAKAVERGVEWASKLDWEGIGNSLKMAAGFAKGLVEGFLAMPDWVKQAVITGWGLNKLTGGAFSNILGSLASGLIKGVLGINAGVVNVRGGVVNGGIGGGIGGVGGAAGKGGRLGGFVGGALKFLPALFAAEVASQASPVLGQVASDIHEEFLGFLPTIKINDLQWPFGSKNTPTILPEVFGGNGLLGGTAAAPPSSRTTANGGRATGGSFAPDDGTSSDTALLREFGGKMEMLATDDVLKQLGRTTEMGLKDVGTSVEDGVKTGMDPLGDIATRILAQARHPKAPEVMNEIQGHLAGLEEIQQTYLDQGDIKLAEKVQHNIDTLHDLIGTTDQTRSVTQTMAQQAAGSDAAMLNSAANQTAHLQTISGLEAGNSGKLTGILNKKTSVTAVVNTTVNVSLQEWQRVQISSLRANSGSGGFI